MNKNKLAGQGATWSYGYLARSKNKKPQATIIQQHGKIDELKCNIPEKLLIPRPSLNHQSPRWLVDPSAGLSLPTAQVSGKGHSVCDAAN